MFPRTKERKPKTKEWVKLEKEEMKSFFEIANST